MKIRLEDLKDEKNASDQMLDWTKKTYRTFDDFVSFRDYDPLWVLAYKLILRLIGIAFMIALSPFLLIGLVIAFAAVF